MYVLRLLGGASLDLESGQRAEPTMQRHRIALLALLATAPGARLSRDKLIALLWPESDKHQARHSLNVAVHALRKAIGVDVIRTDALNLQLNLEALHCDVVRFGGALSAGNAGAAVDAYGGPFLDGFFLDHCEEFEHWQEAERSRLAAQYRESLESLAVKAAAANDPSAAVGWWRRLGAEDPGNARVAANIMVALENAGDRAGALAVAASHQALLATEYGAEPNPGLTALAERIRTRPAGLPRLEPADVGALVPPSSVSAPVYTPPPPPPVAAPVVSSIRRGRYMLAGAALLAAILIAIASTMGDPATGRSDADAVAIAVLPFQNIGADSQYQYLSDGITEELLNALTRVHGLRVAARTSSFLFRNRDADVQEIGKRLGVSALVEGSVRVSGDRLRITAQLIDTRSGFRLWSDDFDRTASDLFAVQENIARAVAAALHVQLAGRIGETMWGTSDPNAHDLYLRGRFQWNRRTEDGMLAARSAFEEALKVDPKYARAYAGLSDAWQLIPLYGHFPTREALANAKTAALRAIALDSMLAEAHTSLAVMLLEYDHDRVGAEREYRRAIDLNPGYATARHWYALFLIAGARVDEATTQAEQARRLDPLSRIINAAVGTVRLFARDYQAAVAEFRAILEREPDWPTGLELLGRAHAAAGDYPAAIAEVERAVTLSSRQPSHVALLAYVYASAGRAADARGLLRELSLARAGSYAPPVDLAAVHVALNEPDEAFRLLRLGVDQRDEEMMYLKVDPRYDPLRRDVRFPDVLRRLGLAQ